MGAAVDCEAIAQGFLGQPVNAVTTLGFFISGLVVIARRPDRLQVGIALIATGVGSLLFHGPMPPGAQWAHDVSLAWLLVVVAATGSRWERLASWPSLVGLSLLIALVPAIADPGAVLLTAVAVVSIIRRDRRPATIGALSLLGVAAILGRLGATGWPLCDPDSLFQLHGAWHLAAAFAVTWWAMAGASSAHTPPPG